MQFADVGYFAGAMAAAAVAGGIKYEQLQPATSAGHLPSASGASLQSGGCSGGGADGSSNLTVTHLGPSFLAHRASCGTSSPTHPPSSLSPPPPAGLLNNKVKNKYATGEHHVLANMYKPNNMGPHPSENNNATGENGEDLMTLEAEISELQRENARVESQMMRLRSDISAMEAHLRSGDKVHNGPSCYNANFESDSTSSTPNAFQMAKYFAGMLTAKPRKLLKEVTT
ncbi:Hypothetical predicted protein [Cloeon dipterum]|uniref:Uncharacterized protein n=1 Tax=Cloeon dipterum TaxID=197152 RepID=A0A8S1DS74_9INSE|nr:Hypothetical predicted protein [Cloeon dipterum]